MKMQTLYLLVPLSVILVVLVAWMIFGAAESRQFDDPGGPDMRGLANDDQQDDRVHG